MTQVWNCLETVETLWNFVQEINRQYRLIDRAEAVEGMDAD